MPQPTEISDEIKIYAGIGVVCVEWALLEHMMLGLISCAENTSLEKTYMMFGTLDMLPRINMALKLARHEKWPPKLSSRIEKIRKEVQGKRQNGLQAKRNQLIHGVHKASDKPESVSLTMVRWGEPKRTQDISVSDIANLANRLSDLAQEASSIFDDYGTWKFGPGSEKDSSEQLSRAESRIKIKIAKDFQGIIKRLFAKNE